MFSSACTEYSHLNAYWAAMGARAWRAEVLMFGSQPLAKFGIIPGPWSLEGKLCETFVKLGLIPEVSSSSRAHRVRRDQIAIRSGDHLTMRDADRRSPVLKDQKPFMCHIPP